MKKLSLTILAAAVLTLPLCAQVTTTLRADIPFEFAAGNATLPAGNYVITFQTGPTVEFLVGGRRYDVLAMSSGPDRSSAQAKLAFQHYGSQYFLSHIATLSRSRDISMSKREQELKKTAVAAGRPIETEIVLATR